MEYIFYRYIISQKGRKAFSRLFYLFILCANPCVIYHKERKKVKRKRDVMIDTGSRFYRCKKGKITRCNSSAASRSLRFFVYSNVGSSKKKKNSVLFLINLAELESFFYFLSSTLVWMFQSMTRVMLMPV